MPAACSPAVFSDVTGDCTARGGSGAEGVQQCEVVKATHDWEVFEILSDMLQYGSSRWAVVWTLWMGRSPSCTRWCNRFIENFGQPHQLPGVGGRISRKNRFAKQVLENNVANLWKEQGGRKHRTLKVRQPMDASGRVPYLQWLLSVGDLLEVTGENCTSICVQYPR